MFTLMVRKPASSPDHHVPASKPLGYRPTHTDNRFTSGFCWLPTTSNPWYALKISIWKRRRKMCDRSCVWGYCKVECCCEKVGMCIDGIWILFEWTLQIYRISIYPTMIQSTILISLIFFGLHHYPAVIHRCAMYSIASRRHWKSKQMSGIWWYWMISHRWNGSVFRR